MNRQLELEILQQLNAKLHHLVNNEITAVPIFTLCRNILIKLGYRNHSEYIIHNIAKMCFNWTKHSNNMEHPIPNTIPQSTITARELALQIYKHDQDGVIYPSTYRRQDAIEMYVTLKREFILHMISVIDERIAILKQPVEPFGRKLKMALYRMIFS